MPCRSDWDDEWGRSGNGHYTTVANVELRDLRLEVERLTRMLCEACRLVVGRANGRAGMSGDLDSWWTKHEELDRRRAELEAAELKRQQEQIKATIKRDKIAKKAMAKLTQEERKALGL